MVEVADTPDLGSGARACRFEPCYPQYIGLAEWGSNLRRFEPSLRKSVVEASTAFAWAYALKRVGLSAV